MPNSLQSSAIASPASRRATNCSLSSITEHSFQGITPSPLKGESVTYVSGTMCYLCLRPLKLVRDGLEDAPSKPFRFLRQIDCLSDRSPVSMTDSLADAIFATARTVPRLGL